MNPRQEGCETRSEKQCRTCSEWKSVESFHRSRAEKDGHQTQCKACQKARLSTPEAKAYRKRQSWLKCLAGFGITEEDYEKMFDEQMGLCAICHKPESGIKLAVDHDHVTGKVRGLLCKRCNMGIGLLGDNSETLTTAALYLRRASNS